ncbi:MAG: DEAD/DEAH box helicase family protein [Anaerolineales bacterium]|nr:DEAD/DEAH box helicase family protein [Anaerolineales bacterium]
MIQEFKFQEDAIKELFNKTNRLLEFNGNKTIIFKAPTGSGKTEMMAMFLQKLVEYRDDQKKFAFIWTAPRQLHIQSKERLEKSYSDSKALKCVYFEDLLDRQINDNEILFLNWESINKTDNVYIRENEQDFNLSAILENTRDAGRNIVLVIDESHHSSKTETSQELIQLIDPKVTIEVSATPNMQGDENVTVQREEVVKAGLIKEFIVINPEFQNEITKQTADTLSFTSKGEENTDEFVLRKAIEKREELAKGFQELGINVNPLLLIQLPDRKQGEEDFKEEIEKILEKNHKITVKNGKLAIYLSEDKENLENISRNDSEVEVMIFKQAIALGWDCPRASILALFRDWKSIQFSVQTVGRILRMPELKHYDNEELNTAFVYTSLQDLSIIEDITGKYFTIRYASRKKDYKSIELKSFHAKRFREETRLNPDFIRHFLQVADKMDLKNKIKMNSQDVSVQLLSDGKIQDIDKHHQVSDVQHVQRKQTVTEIQKIFDAFARESLLPDFFPEMRSVGRVKDAIHNFFKVKFPKEFTTASTRGQVIVLAKENIQLFRNAIDQAKKIYAENVGKQKREMVANDKWEVPFSRKYDNRFSKKDYKKSVLQPYFQPDNAPETEKKFAEFLNNTHKNVEWFFKNGESDGTSFAIKYKDDSGEEKLFFVDWIVKYKNGQIGLYDTKEGITAQTAKYRAEGLASYIKSENKKGKKLVGGIVAPKDKTWRLNNKEKYDYSEDLKGWEYLE